MSDLTFKLEGVVHVKDDMEDFEGPLTLILLLLSKNKIEIKDIKISEILDQYLEYLAEMEKMDLEIASEFVSMASHLVYIKTRTLLASDEEEISELQELINSLESLKNKDCYIGIKSVIDELLTDYSVGKDYLKKPAEPAEVDSAYDYSHNADILVTALKDLFSKNELRIQSEKNISFTMPKAIAYSVTKKSEEIINLIKDGKKHSLSHIFQETKSKSELVAAFLSVLELCKMGSILIEEDKQDLSIVYTGVYNSIESSNDSPEETEI